MKLLTYIKAILTKNTFIDLKDVESNYHIESEYKKTRINPDGSIEYELLIRVVVTKK